MLSAAVRISQPSLSHAIAQLEQELGDPFIQYTHGSGLRHVINDMFAQIDASPNVAYEIQEDQVIAGSSRRASACRSFRIWKCCCG